MKKVLIVSTVSRQFYLFEQGNIEVLKSLGYEIHAAANYSDANERLKPLKIIMHHFDIERSPFSLKNIKAYRQLKKLMKLEKFDIVHCHSPMGGVIGRLAAKSVKIPSVIYTAHGFHFYNGAPFFNWLVYYTVERWLARYTDILITINKEDYERAKDNFKAKKTVYIPGVGVDVGKFSSCISMSKRREFGIPEDAFVILSVGELNKNKNHEVIIKAMGQIDDSKTYYVICGQGDKLVELQALANKLGISQRIKFLGYRNDVNEIYQIADIFAFPSFREGLSVSLMEAMASGLPILCSDIRGNIDLVENKKGGFLKKPSDVRGFVKSIYKLKDNEELRFKMGEYNSQKIELYSREKIIEKMKDIYTDHDELFVELTIRK